MAEPARDEDDKIAVTLTVRELKALVKAAAREAIADTVKPPSDWVDVETAAQHFGVSGQTIRNWIDDGAPAINPGGNLWRIQLAEFRKWAESNRPKRLKRVK